MWKSINCKYCGLWRHCIQTAARKQNKIAYDKIYLPRWTNWPVTASHCGKVNPSKICCVGVCHQNWEFTVVCVWPHRKCINRVMPMFKIYSIHCLLMYLLTKTFSWLGTHWSTLPLAMVCYKMPRYSNILYNFSLALLDCTFHISFFFFSICLLLGGLLQKVLH